MEKIKRESLHVLIYAHLTKETLAIKQFFLKGP